MLWSFLIMYSKLQEESDILKELLNEKQSEVKDFENFQPVHIAKQEKACSWENTKNVAKKPLHKV